MIDIGVPGDAKDDHLFSLQNARGMCVTVSDRGAAIVSWLAPDRDGTHADVVLAYAHAENYLDNPFFLGAVIGRWANRIAQGRFTIDGEAGQVVVNDRGNHLHGGPEGFHTKRWRGAYREDAVEMRLSSPAGASGFPGKLDVIVRYHLDGDGALTIDYEAVSDAPTPINLTSHPYFNLNGGTADIRAHVIQVAADQYLPTDVSGIPISLASVHGTAFDLRRPAEIGERLRWPDAQLRQSGGFDHCYCVRGRAAGKAREPCEVARVVDPGSGRELTVSTTEAGLQFYTGNYLAISDGRAGRRYERHDGFCLEAGAFPNQINGEDAAAVILLPGQVYRQRTVYHMGLASGPEA